MGTLWLIVEDEGKHGPLAFGLPLPQGEFVVGRSKDCHLALTGSKISRRHVSLVRKGDAVTFKDLGSSAGILLNGEPVTEGSLAPGDRLSVGRHRLGIQDKPPARPASSPRPPSLITGKGERTRAPDPTGDWNPFKAFMDKLRSSNDPADLLERLLLGLVEIFQAERGYVLLADRPGEKLVPVVSHKIGDTEKFVSISQTVYKKALETANVVFVPNTLEDAWYLSASGRSLENTPRSIVCGPLTAGGKTFGVIYVDGTTALDKTHIPFFETVTGFAAELLRAVRTRKSLVSAQGQIGALNALAWEGERLVSGEGEASRELQRLVAAAAPQDVNALITGETGTGKEMVARAIHRMSPRRNEPFIPVNCAALPRDIIEAELFGAEKGAFTGAVDKRIGRFELASSGTLFLDEIGELPEEVQVKLLRVLEERTVRRLGGTEVIPLRFRLVCATNKDLETAVREGGFRQDLYYRINVFRIHLKPLRERPEDILPLARHFLDQFASRFARSIDGLAPAAQALLTGYAWPGNIRELRNAIERAVLVETDATILPHSLPLAGPTPGAPAPRTTSGGWLPEDMPTNYEQARKVFERAFLERIVELAGGNVTAAAKQAGMTRSAIYRRLSKLGITPDEL